jgi:phosphatidylglycerophosphatase A
VTRLALLLATWFGCGYFPWGPGTVGSLAAIVIAALLHFYAGVNRGGLLLIAAALLIPGIWASTQTALFVRKEDPGLVVIDEVLGQWVTLAGAAVLSWKTFVAGFLLFRLFDIWKPWPVRNFEKLAGGAGIVADDLAAGIYGALILYIGGSAGLI